MLLGLSVGPGASFALAQSWPAKPIRVVIPFGAGSAVDVIPRIVLDQMSKQLGQAVIVENRVGAGGTLGMSQVAKADPDGYTLLVNSSAHTIVPSVYKTLSFDVAQGPRRRVPARQSAQRADHGDLEGLSRPSPISSLPPRPSPARSTSPPPASAPRRT